MNHSTSSTLTDSVLTRATASSVPEFRALANSSFVPLNITAPHDRRGFRAVLTSATADDVHFTEVHAHAHQVERSENEIRNGGSGFVKVSLLLAGSSLLVQDGREVVMRPGDLSVYDTSRPYSLLFDAEFRNLIMMFPKDRLLLSPGCSEQVTAVSLTQEHPELASLVTGFMAHFPSQLSTLAPAVQTKLARTSVDLFGTLLSSVLDMRPSPRDPHRMLMNTITDYIEHHLGSSVLNPGSIAEAHFISVRHLHALFRESGGTVSAWIRQRRLERCREELTDSLHAHRTVAAISQRWGFADAAHFSRIFKQEFGVTPSELRG